MNAADTFDRADGDMNGSTASDGVHVWTARVGTWAIVSNQADPSNTANAHITINPSTANIDATVVLATMAGANFGGLAIRWSDADNYVKVEFSTTQARIRTRIATVESNVSTAVITAASGDTLRVIANGDQISLYHNGVEVITPQTVTHNQTATVQGLIGEGSTNWKFNNFSLTDLDAAPSGNRRRRSIICGAAA